MRIVVAQPVESGLADTCRIHDECALWCRHPGEAAPAAEAACAFLREWIVPAGVEDKHADACAAPPNAAENRIDGDGFRCHEAFLAGRRFWDVSWQEIVASLDLDTVPGKEKQGLIARTELRRKTLNFRVHLASRQIGAAEHLETDGCERVAHGPGVILRFFELGYMLIGIVADDEGMALGFGREAAGNHK